MVSWGLLVNGPSGHAFYAILDRKVIGCSVPAIATKIVIDQLLYTPPLTAGFFGYMALAAGGSLADAVYTVRQETWPTLVYNWSFWSVAHIITFTYIPLEHRVAWVAAKNFAWSFFLSWRVGRLESWESQYAEMSTTKVKAVPDHEHAERSEKPAVRSARSLPQLLREYRSTGSSRTEN